MSDDVDLDVLSESFAEMLGAEWPREKAIAHAKSDAGLVPDLWSAMADLGWTALTVPEAHGGLALGLDAAARLHMALGAAVVPAPMLGTTLAADLLARGGSEAQQARWLPGLADGSICAAFAPPTDVPITADGSELCAVYPDLIDAASATALFLRAARAGASGWLIVPVAAAGVSIARHPIVDTTHTLGTVTLADVRIDDDAFIATSPAVDEAVLRVAAVALAADAIGVGDAVLACTIEYMKTREQFGVLIGSFQALKHRVADHKAALVAARGLVDHAARLGSDDPEALLAALSAKQHTAKVVAEVARDCIQLHGGVGYTAEFFPHVFLKRAKLNEMLFGTRTALLDHIADLLETA